MPVPAEHGALERDLLRDQAYVAIRDAIVDGTLAPEERLRDQELCAWLGLSRTPVREALSRLEQDGLVETAPQRFTRVAPLDRRAARDAFPVVAALHALAAELALPRLTDADRERHARGERGASPHALRAADVDAALAADDAFHGVFVTASANAEITARAGPADAAHPAPRTAALRLARRPRVRQAAHRDPHGGARRTSPTSSSRTGSRWEP